MPEPDHGSPIAELLRDCPVNWGRWGDDDEIGALNYLTAKLVLTAVECIRSGRTFTLQIQMGRPGGDPVWPGRSGVQRYNTIDRGHFTAGKAAPNPGGIEYADDYMACFLQGTTQYDGLGHAWYGDKLYNGFDAATTIGSLAKASVLPIAERGIVGRGVLLDIARLRGKESLDRGETFDHTDLLECARAQGAEIRKNDIVLIRTGWLGSFYRKTPEEFYGERFIEPGLKFSRELVEWFHEMEIPNLVTDTIGNELTFDEDTGCAFALHAALMRNLGVLMTEMASLDGLADDCAADSQYDFLYVAAPLKVVGGTGAPVNPVVIK
jgi:kynurenine formamidase